MFYGNNSISSFSNSIASVRKVSVVISSFGAGSEKVNSGGASKFELYLSQVMLERWLRPDSRSAGAFGSRLFVKKTG